MFNIILSTHFSDAKLAFQDDCIVGANLFASDPEPPTKHGLKGEMI